MVTAKFVLSDSQGNKKTVSADFTVAAAPTGNLPAMHRVGISSSRQGLNAGETHKRAETLTRYQQFANQLGITATQMKKSGGRHVYDTTNNPVPNVMSIGVFENCVEDGYGCVMLTSSRWSDMAGAANGSYDTTIKNCLASMSAQNIKVVWNVKHEPSNNGWSAAEAASWRKLQARMAWLVFAHNDPNIHYTDCHIPMAGDEAQWNWMQELKDLRPSDWQSINARTYIGMDPYPEIGSGGTLQTIKQKVGPAMTYLRAQGRTGPLCLPEVALFNWVISSSSTGPLTPAQQAQRIHDELWTWGQQNRLLSYFYYDVADLNDSDVRDSSRMLENNQELLEYAKLIRGDYYGS